MLRPERLALVPRSFVGVVFATACGGPPAPTPLAKHETRQRAESRAKATLDPRTVVTAFRGNEPSLHSCFNLSGETARGTLRLAWRVDATGTASRARVEEAKVLDPTIGECLREQITALHFGQREAPAEARWTFVSRLFDPPPPDDEEKKKERARKRKGKRDERREPPVEKGVSIEPSSPGFIEPRAVDDVVQANFGLFAHCYRAALERHPGLSGVVRLRFVIAPGGRVVNVRDAGSELPDGRLVDCVAEGFYALSFPKTPDDEVRVLYRLVFDSGVSG
jgi:hypothetical protein